MSDHASPRGIIAAVLTPLGADLRPDHDAFVAHCRMLLGGGCDGLCVLGTTGEANSLAFDDRLALIDRAAEALPAGRLIVGAGSCSLADAVQLTRACLDRGMPNVLMLPPFYYRPVTDEGVYGFMAALIEAVGDPDLRLHLYNFPALTGYAFGVGVTARLKAAFGPVIAGMKDSSGDWEHMAEICRGVPDFAVYSGTERHLLEILEIGGAGCITAPANAVAADCQAVYAAWRNGAPDAAALQARLTRLRTAIESSPPVPGLKGLFAGWTGNGDWLRMLPPHVPLSGAETDALARSLVALGHVPPSP